MENEKNNGFHKKSRFNKPKSYFIEPPAEKKEQEPQAKDNGERNPAEKQNGGRPNNHHHNKHHNKGDRQKNNRQESPENAQVVDVSTAPEQGGKKQDGFKSFKNKNKHNKPKNKPVQKEEQNANAASDVAPNAAPAAKEGQAQENNQKSKKKDRPLRRETKTVEIPEIDESDYEQIRFPSTEENDKTTAAIGVNDASVPMVEVVGIRFKSSGKVYYFAPNGNVLRRGQYAIVETARGMEYGEVSMGNKEVRETETVSPLRPVIRIATPADKQHHEDNKKKEDDAFRICNERIASHKLDMKLIDAQYTFDNSKLLFYFSSSGRVDFRDLVKDLASVFRTRIELRQIGIRDEAKLMGGVGICGRPLCCASFLSDFCQVSIKMAKEQGLSLGGNKYSGICGKLMCCLRYEHETYEYETKRTPPVDALVRTADGVGIVTDIHPLMGTVKVRLTASPDTPPKTYKREDVIMLQKKQNKDT